MLRLFFVKTQSHILSNNKALDLKRPDITDQELLLAMAEHPILLERPIVVTGARGVVGRPPENVLSLLDEENGS